MWADSSQNDSRSRYDKRTDASVRWGTKQACPAEQMNCGEANPIPGEGHVLAFAKHNPTSPRIVWRDFDLHSVTRNDSDEVLAHPPSNVSHDLMADIELHQELGVGKCLGHRSLHFNAFFLRHSQPFPTRDTPPSRKPRWWRRNHATVATVTHLS